LSGRFCNGRTCAEIEKEVEKGKDRAERGREGLAWEGTALKLNNKPFTAFMQKSPGLFFFSLCTTRRLSGREEQRVAVTSRRLFGWW
jgi:hypothetical protein